VRKAIVRKEWLRERTVKFAAVCAADRFLSAALASPAQRREQGVKLEWTFGPTSPIAPRQDSRDDLGGLRVIGRLDYRDGRFISMIFALRYVPGNASLGTKGRIAFLEGGDNCRLLARLHRTGVVAQDHLFESFDVNDEDRSRNMTMRTDLHLDETTGKLANDKITSSSLGMRCIHCHARGSNQTAAMSEPTEQRRAVEIFIGMAKANGLSFGRTAGAIRDAERLTDQMLREGPTSVLPLAELHRANRTYWAEISAELFRQSDLRFAAALRKVVPTSSWPGVPNR
jgi:hypothetical protein